MRVSKSGDALLDIDKIQRVGKLAGELLSSGMAKDSQDAMRRAEDMLLKQQETHLTNPFMRAPSDEENQHEHPMRIKKEEDVDYNIIVRKFTIMVDEQKKEVETLRAMMARMQKEMEEIKVSASRRYEAPYISQPAVSHASDSRPETSDYVQPAPLTGFGESVSVSRSVPPPAGAPMRRMVPIIGPDGKPVNVQPHVSSGGGDNIPTTGSNPRSGDYKPSDVSIEKFFYSGSRKR